jgi:hypothetical protein
MAGHSYVSQIPDPATQRALLDALGQIKALTARVATLEATTVTTTASLDAKNQRVINVAAPTADTDAVNLSTLRAYVAAQGAF